MVIVHTLSAEGNPAKGQTIMQLAKVNVTTAKVTSGKVATAYVTKGALVIQAR